MKKILFFIIICLAKTTIHAQSGITVSYVNADFKDVLQDLVIKTKLDVMYSEKCLRHSKPVTIKAKNIPTDSLLKHIFKSQPFEYVMMNSGILIFPKSVKGRVIDMEGRPIKDVIVRGELQTTRTDSKGEFILQHASCDSVITLFHTQYLNYTFIPPPRTFTIMLKARFK